MTPKQGIETYLTYLARALPGGVACDVCHIVNTYGHVSLQWKDLGENKYSFRQTVECDKCGHRHTYVWEQQVRPDFGITMPKSFDRQEGKNA